jgi:hypothetical protein
MDIDFPLLSSVRTEERQSYDGVTLDLCWVIQSFVSATRESIIVRMKSYVLQTHEHKSVLLMQMTISNVGVAVS